MVSAGPEGPMGGLGRNDGGQRSHPTQWVSGKVSWRRRHLGGDKKGEEIGTFQSETSACKSSKQPVALDGGEMGEDEGQC